MKKQTFTLLALIGLILLGPSLANAETFAPPDDPTQSITYWKPHSLSAEQDPLAAEAQAVFSVLLRAWDRSRLEPRLYVVDSASGPWAASLADGNILISRAAITACFRFGEARAKHLLAFVLAHELAHQGSDDLWHQRFFRLMGNQSPELKQKMLRDLNLDDALWQDVSQKEAQADHDGLIMMSSVGYDPYQILDQQDFFTAWVENIWQQACDASATGTIADEACLAAQSRALRTRTQLKTVATQAMLYELGVQAFTAGQYLEARRYFTAYGRDITNRALRSALGLSYFAEALALHQILIAEGGLQMPAFRYPLLLDAVAMAQPSSGVSLDLVKRSARDVRNKQNLKKMQHSLERGIKHFEKAIVLEPNHAPTYLLLAQSYLLSKNTFMARGIIQGKYIPRFGHDAASGLLLAMTLALEGDKAAATQAFDHLLAQLFEKSPKKSLQPRHVVLPYEVIVYTASHNSAAFAAFSGDPNESKVLWNKLAKHAQQSGRALLFRLAVSHLSTQKISNNVLQRAPTIQGMRLGDHYPAHNASQAATEAVTPLWIEGERYQVVRSLNGSRFVLDANRQIISAWQDAGEASLAGKFSVGDAEDRPLKTLGMPDRRLHLLPGDYLAYDQYGLAVHIQQKKIAGWFLYEKK